MTPRRESRGVPQSQMSSSLRSRELWSPGPGVSPVAEAEHVEGSKSHNQYSYISSKIDNDYTDIESYLLSKHLISEAPCDPIKAVNNVIFLYCSSRKRSSSTRRRSYDRSRSRSKSRRRSRSRSRGGRRGYRSRSRSGRRSRSSEGYRLHVGGE